MVRHSSRYILAVIFVSIIALFTFPAATAHWLKGYDFSMKLQDGGKLTNTTAFNNAYHTIAYEFTPALATTQQQSADINFVRFDYAFGDYVVDVKDCYSTVGDDVETQYEFISTNYTRGGGNYTVVLEYNQTITPALFNLTMGQPKTTVWCDVMFSAFPTSTLPAFPGGCFSADLASVPQVTTTNGTHGYAAYEPAHNYDLQNCLPYNKDDFTNAQHYNVFSTIIDYKQTVVLSASISGFEKKSCGVVIDQLVEIALDAMWVYVKTAASASIPGAAPTKTPLSSICGQHDGDDDGYTATLLVEIAAGPVEFDLMGVMSQVMTVINDVPLMDQIVSFTYAEQIVPPSCGDGIVNGDETDKDCGGSGCNVRCRGSQRCLVDEDCQSLLCTNGACVGSNYNAAIPVQSVHAAAILGVVVVASLAAFMF